MLTNFYKCAIFYLLDVVKYLIIYVPVIVILHIIGMHAEWKRTKPHLDKALAWPNSIQNNCYRCKNKKGEKFALLDTLKKMFEKEGVDDSPFNFLFFLMILFVSVGFFYTLWHIYSNNNMSQGVSMKSSVAGPSIQIFIFIAICIALFNYSPLLLTPYSNNSHIYLD